uniref:Uncharacterized protein n=1 Tax=Arundo donax TaxID=35708 RepID=A0A0A9AI25_ARUDO
MVGGLAGVEVTEDKYQRGVGHHHYVILKGVETTSLHGFFLGFNWCSTKINCTKEKMDWGRLGMAGSMRDLIEGVASGMMDLKL